MSDAEADKWVQVASVDEIEEDDVIAVELDDREMALYCVDGNYYLTSDMCTHEKAHLSDGFLDGTVIECPLHQGTFCIKTGKALSPPVEVPIETYETKVDAGVIFAKLNG